MLALRRTVVIVRPWITKPQSTLISNDLYISVSRRFSSRPGFRRARNTQRRGQLLQHEQQQQYDAGDNNGNGNGSNNGNDEKDYSRRLGLAMANGLIFFSLAIGALFVSDKFFSNRRQQEIDSLYKELEKDLGMNLNYLTKKYEDEPALFQCVVRLTNKPFENMFPVKVGDTVDILKEGIGPNGSFNLCRTKMSSLEDSVIVGVYPVFCLQPFEDYQKAVSTVTEDLAANDNSDSK